MSESATIRVVLPYLLQDLAKTGPEVRIEVEEPVTAVSIIGALESRYPMLQGAIIDHNTGRRRPLLRFFACSEDWSFEAGAKSVPEEIRNGEEPFIILGAISGG